MALLLGAVSAYSQEGSQGSVAFQMVNGSIFGQAIFNVNTLTADNNTEVSYNGYTVIEEQGSTSGGAVAPGSKENPTGTSVYSGAPLTGTGYSAQMLGAAGADQPLSALSPLTSWTGSGILNFYTVTAFAGFVSGVDADSIPGTTSEAPVATIAIAAWDNGGGQYTTLAAAQAAGEPWGISALANITTTFWPNSPAAMSTTASDLNLSFSLGMPPTNYAPIIVGQPQSLVVNAYDTASFSVTATGSEPLSYQWSFNSTNIVGATSNSLTIPHVVQTNLGTYAVFITNAFGTTNSSNATLSMYPFLALPFGGLDTYWGYTNTLSVGAWGTGPLDYQWFDDGNAINDATNETLTLTSIQAANAGLYSVVVSSALGSVTNTPEQVVVNPAGVSLGLSPTLTISGVVGYNYIIQSTSNLSNTNSWITMTNLTLTQPIQLWVDTNTDASQPGNPQRFYQVLPGQ